MSRRRTQEEFVDEMSHKNPGVIVLGTYRTAKEPVLVECSKCGYRWEARPYNLLGSKNKAPSGCPKCANNTLGNTEDFIQEMREIDSSLTILGEYKGNKQPIRVRCSKCGNTWATIPNSLRRGHGCPKCANRRRGLTSRLTNEQFVSRIKSANPYVDVVGSYRRAQEKVLVRCRNCGHEWEGIPSNLLQGSGCPRCNHSGTSYMQQFILGAFRAVLGKRAVLDRDSGAIGLELDIYIPSMRAAIEPGSWNWHKNSLERDQLKRKLCTEGGIRLITIYDSFDAGEKPFESDCYTFETDLGVEPGHASLRVLALQLMEDVGIVRELLPEIDWERVDEFARDSSRRLSTKQFASRLLKANPGVEVLGEYERSTTKLAVRCLECGHVFMATPATLIRGQGCPKCRYVKSAGALRKAESAFKAELEHKAPSIEVIGSYKTTHAPIKVRCKSCGYEWNPTPRNLLAGHGCPRCAGCERINTPVFVQRMRALHPDITILGKYINNRTGVRCKCNICGWEWEASPKSLGRGSGCPECAKRRRAQNRRLSSEEYSLRLQRKTGNIELASAYSGMDEKILARCRVCGEELHVTAGELLHRACLRHVHAER